MKLYISTTLFTILFVLNSSPDFSWSKSPFLYGGRPKSITSEGRLKLSAIYSAFSSFHTDYNTYDVESYLNKNPEVSFPGQQGLTFLGYDPTMGVSRFASGIFPNSRIQNGKKKNLEGYIFPTTGDGFLSNSENVVNLVSKICADCTAGESRYKAFSIMNYTRGEDSEVYFYTIDQNKNLELERLGRLDELLKKFKIIPVVPVPVPAPVNNPTFSDRASGYYQSYKYVVLMILVYLVGVFSIRQLFLREEDYR